MRVYADIVSLASPRGILELPSAVFSICQNLYQKLVFCWHVYDTCTNYKFINWYPDVTTGMLVKCTTFFWRIKCFGKGTSTVYAVVEIKRAFLDSTKISASEEPNSLEKVRVQFIPLQKLGRKFHFLVRFYTSSWNGTYKSEISPTDPALWAGREKLVSASRNDEEKHIKCNVCAAPPVNSFTWEFKGGPLRRGIVKSVSKFLLKCAKSVHLSMFRI